MYMRKTATYLRTSTRFSKDGLDTMEESLAFSQVSCGRIGGLSLFSVLSRYVNQVHRRVSSCGISTILLVPLLFFLREESCRHQSYNTNCLPGGSFFLVANAHDLTRDVALHRFISKHRPTSLDDDNDDEFSSSPPPSSVLSSGPLAPPLPPALNALPAEAEPEKPVSFPSFLAVTSFEPKPPPAREAGRFTVQAVTESPGPVSDVSGSSPTRQAGRFLVQAVTEFPGSGPTPTRKAGRFTV
ncbi:hypothetical protein CSUI_005980, partial [Cystoisospora suis]